MEELSRNKLYIYIYIYIYIYKICSAGVSAEELSVGELLDTLQARGVSYLK